MSQSESTGGPRVSAGQELLDELRTAESATDAPLNIESRKVTTNDGTPYINPTDYGMRTLRLSAGDEVRVATFRDALVIYREGALE